jgi:hypothetical protein
MNNMKLVEKIKERKEIRKQVNEAIDAGNQAFADAFAKALRMEPLDVDSRTTFGMGKMHAKSDTGFRLENVLHVTTFVHRQGLYRFMKKMGRGEGQ